VRWFVVVGLVVVLCGCGGAATSGNRQTDTVNATPTGASSIASDRESTSLLRSLSILRQPQALDPQVEREVHSWRANVVPTGVLRARLLGIAPSGSAFVLLAVNGWREYDFATRSDSRPYDALCLMRRGTQGGAGSCASVAQMRTGALFGALAGQVYGVVPDGVAQVRPKGSAVAIPVRHNFYSYSVRITTPPYTEPVWADAQGRTVPKRWLDVARIEKIELADISAG
jgi:hypothetical protein